MPLLQLHHVDLAYGSTPLLQGVNLTIEKGERLALIGRNGVGKSSFLKLISREIMPDSGRIIADDSLKIASLHQALPTHLRGTIYDVVSEGFESLASLKQEYNALITSEHKESSAHLDKLGQLQQKLEAQGAWGYEQKIEEILSRLALNPYQAVATLSGGWLRRVLLAKALVTSPDILLLDEPTNHLDVETIEWLETVLMDTSRGAILFVSHDRRFLERLATKIIELDRGVLTHYPGNYESYLKEKAIADYNEEQSITAFDKKLAEEELWLKKGVKARRTRSQDRVNALIKMRQAKGERLEKMKKATLSLEEGEFSGRIVIHTEGLTYRLDDKLIVDKLSFTLLRGDKVGIIGPNGVGKSTLIKLLLREIEPTGGIVKLGTQLEICYFDQQRLSLDLEKTVRDNIAGGNDFIEVNGKKRHVIGWLQDFLFTPDKAQMPVKALSGGEQNRLLLAKLFTQPCNFLIMDEPTNDLDIETLELLEELLAAFQGTLLLITHDRYFLDNVVTSLLVFEGGGVLRESIGGYQEWYQTTLRDERKGVINQSKGSHSHQVKEERKKGRAKKRKLSYHEVRELEALPQTIETLENRIATLSVLVQAPHFYEEPYSYQDEKLKELTTLNEELELKYNRWLELESYLE